MATNSHNLWQSFTIKCAYRNDKAITHNEVEAVRKDLKFNNNKYYLYIYKNTVPK